jgi:pyruvate/2-oxoglutarate dehydrogenase complex dihydrolipoamide acyltransferase (E2) component
VSQVTEGVGEATQRVGDAAGQAVGQVGQTANQAVGQATDQVQETAEQASEEAESQSGVVEDEEPYATHAARQKAEQLGVNLSEVEGSGAGGRIKIADVVQAAQE